MDIYRNAENENREICCNLLQFIAIRVFLLELNGQQKHKLKFLGKDEKEKNGEGKQEIEQEEEVDPTCDPQYL